MLSQRSIQAISHLRAYTPPSQTQWHNCPLTRRAAVLILLFPDRRGELKVVLTMRAASLRSYAGQAALPGGKADHLQESPFMTARREAFEEIGLPMSDAKLASVGFRVEHLCEMPASFAKTELAVLPCIAFLCPSSMSSTSTSETAHDPGGNSINNTPPPTSEVEDKMIPRLDPKEVAAVFTAPFHNFLGTVWEGNGIDGEKDAHQHQPFYTGSWTTHKGTKWRMHNFYVPKPPPPPPSSSTSSSSSSSSSRTDAADSSKMIKDGEVGQDEQYYRVFGMTARILIDAARLAYDEEPAFEHNGHVGDEALLERLLRRGVLGDVARVGKAGKL